MTFENIIQGLIQVGITSLIGVIFVDFCDRKFPKMLGVKND